jgi:hypothetical protein
MKVSDEDRRAAQGQVQHLSDALMRDPHLAAKFYPHAAQEDSYLIRKPNPPAGSSAPIPPRALWYGYADTEDGYLAWGREVVGTIKGVLSSSGFDVRPGQRVLDLTVPRESCFGGCPISR